MNAIKTLANAMPTRYLRDFFSEKDLPEVNWEIEDSHGTTHFISNVVVVEAMTQCSKAEAKGLERMLTLLDFRNADINDYLKHLAGALVNTRAS